MFHISQTLDNGHTWVVGVLSISKSYSIQIFKDGNTNLLYSTLQVYQRSYSQVRHIPPKMSDKCLTNLRVNTL